MSTKWDGKSRPSNKAYEESWNRIFKTNPVAKEVRTSKYKPKVVKPKKGKGSFKRKKSEVIDTWQWT
jgi:alternative ribosome-rescue factor